VSGQGKSKPDFRCSECKLRVKWGMVFSCLMAPDCRIALSSTSPSRKPRIANSGFFDSLHAKFASKQSERHLDSSASVTYYHHDDVGFHPDVHVYLLLYACVFWHGEADDLRIT
jgi:hypothetical protein